MTTHHHEDPQQCYKMSKNYLVMETNGLLYSGHFDLVSHILKNKAHLEKLGNMRVGDLLGTHLDGYSLSIKRSPKGHYVVEPNDDKKRGNYIVQIVDIDDYEKLNYLGTLLEARNVIENINSIIELAENMQLMFTSSIFNITIYACRKDNLIIFSGKKF